MRNRLGSTDIDQEYKSHRGKREQPALGKPGCPGAGSVQPRARWLLLSRRALRLLLLLPLLLLLAVLRFVPQRLCQRAQVLADVWLGGQHALEPPPVGRRVLGGCDMVVGGQLRCAPCGGVALLGRCQDPSGMLQGEAGGKADGLGCVQAWAGSRQAKEDGRARGAGTGCNTSHACCNSRPAGKRSA